MPIRNTDSKTYRFGRFSSSTLGLAAFIAANAAAFARGADQRIIVLACAAPPFLVWLRLRVRLTKTHLVIRNLFSSASFALDSPETRIWVTSGALYASTNGGAAMRAWGSDGNKKSRNESGVEKLEALCFTLLQRTFERDGAVLDLE